MVKKDDPKGGDLSLVSKKPARISEPLALKIKPTKRPTTRSAGASPACSPSLNRNQSPQTPMSKVLASSRKNGSPTRDAPTDLLAQLSDALLDVTTDQPVSSLSEKSRRNLGSCPCNESANTSWKVDCAKCKQFWHANCLGLKGISQSSINKMVDYLCPYCYVAPVPTINPVRETCFVCRNTETLQNLNITYEVNEVANKIEAIKSLDTLLSGINVERLIGNVQILEKFDLHLQHLLINADKFQSYQDTVTKIAVDIQNIKDRPTTGTSSDTTSSTDITELTAQIKDLSDQVEGFTLLQAQTVNKEGSTSIKDLEKICNNITAEVERLSKGTVDMGSKINGLHETVNKTPPMLIHPTRTGHPQEPLLDLPPAPPIHHGQIAIERVRETFISAKETEDLKVFLQDEAFVQEHGRTVLGYGEPYHYPGSKTNKKRTVFPPLIQNLVNKINGEFNPPTRPTRKDGTPGDEIPGPLVNQCLINKYTGSARMPEHSDDESSIDPSSSIFTISVGAECKITFKEKSTGNQLVHTCNSDSLYSMTRKSQEYFTHMIPSHELGTEVRYSLTFRRCLWSYKNALLVMGDSLTAKLKFGTGKDTFGFTTPGEKKFAAKIEDIDPTYCAAYPNIVLMCGINSIRQDGVGEEEVKELYIQYKNKVEQVRVLNSKCNIYVCPIMPTKDDQLNKKAILFNKFIFEDLSKSPSCSVVTIEGIAELLDSRTNRLCERLSFHNDDLHINHAGGRIVAKNIKKAIFETKLNRQTFRVHTSRSYAQAAGGGVQSRRRVE